MPEARACEKRGSELQRSHADMYCCRQLQHCPWVRCVLRTRRPSIVTLNALQCNSSASCRSCSKEREDMHNSGADKRGRRHLQHCPWMCATSALAIAHQSLRYTCDTKVLAASAKLQRAQCPSQCSLGCFTTWWREREPNDNRTLVETQWSAKVVRDM